MWGFGCEKTPVCAIAKTPYQQHLAMAEVVTSISNLLILL